MQTKQIQFDRIRKLGAGQFVVECNVSADSEIKSLLCVSADVGDIRAAITAGQIAVSGKIGVNVIYETEEGVDSADHVTDFSKLLSDEGVGDGAKALVDATIADTETELRGNSVAVRIVVQLSPAAVETQSLDVFDGEDGTCEKRRTLSLIETVADIDAEVETEEKYSVGSGVEKVLGFTTAAVICKQTATETGLSIDGEICADVIYLSDGEMCRKTFSMPFAKSIDAPENCCALAVVSMKESALNVGGKADDATLTLTAKATVSGFVLRQFDEEVICDVYSPCHKLEFSCPCLSFDEIVDTSAYRERISGSVSVADGEADAARVVCARVAECDLTSVTTKDGCIVTEGVVTACVVYETEDGGKSSVKVELPYALDHEARDVKEGDFAFVGAGCCDLFAKVKRGREIEVGATLAFSALATRTCRATVVTEATVGEKLEDDGEAIVVVSAKKGETAWDLAKRLCVRAEEVESFNPSVEFPAEGGEKIVVYRMLAM